MLDEKSSPLNPLFSLKRALLFSFAAHLLVLLTLAPVFVEERPGFSPPPLQAQMVGRTVVAASARPSPPLSEPAPVSTAQGRGAVVRSTRQTGVVHGVRRGAKPSVLPDPVQPAESVASSQVSHPALPQPTAPAAPETKSSADADDLRQYRMALAIEARRFRRYPALAREQGWEGVVEVGVEIKADTLPRLLLNRSSGHALLDETALEMMRQSVRAVPLPAGLRGREFRFLLPVRFSLEEVETQR